MIRRQGDSMKKYGYFLATVLIFSGCGVKKKSIKNTQMFMHFQEVIAKNADIPDAPFQAQLQSISRDAYNQNQLELVYTTNMARVDLVHFYTQQMERAGWSCTMDFHTVDHCMIFSKPGKVCAIVVQDGTYFVFMGKK